MRRVNTIAPALAAALGLAAVGGCVQEKSERVLLIEASTLAQSGQTEEARAIFDDLLADGARSSDVLIRYAGFLVDTGEFDAAWAVFEELEELELHGTDRSRLETERRRYFQRIYDDARGPGPAGPADRDAYERGLIGLINIDRAGPLLDEYEDYLIMQARAALGRSPEQPMELPPDAVVQAASGEQIETALVYLDRLIDGDPRCEVRTVLEGTRLAEAETLRAALRVERFRVEFDRRWSTRFRDAFVADGRFDRERDVFRHAYVGPYREGFSAESGPDRLQHQARTWHAREVATDLAYELVGEERGDAPPLEYRVEDFASTEASAIGEDADGNFTFDLTIPYATVLRGGWLLRARLDAERAAAEAAEDEGSGAP